MCEPQTCSCHCHSNMLTLNFARIEALWWSWPVPDVPHALYPALTSRIELNQRHCFRQPCSEVLASLAEMSRKKKPPTLEVRTAGQGCQGLFRGDNFATSDHARACQRSTGHMLPPPGGALIAVANMVHAAACSIPPFLLLTGGCCCAVLLRWSSLVTPVPLVPAGAAL